MTVQLLTASDAITRLGDFSTVIDARSESEFAYDHLPGAINWPSRTDAERHEIGTLYKQVNPFEAKKRGAAKVAANIARHIEREVIDKPRGWQPLIYCWRGGKRSGSLALILDQIGFRVHLIEGGYKAFRSAVLKRWPTTAARCSVWYLASSNRVKSISIRACGTLCVASILPDPCLLKVKAKK